MARSFREIVENDDSLMQLLNFADKYSIDEEGAIKIGDFFGTWYIFDGRIFATK